MNRIYFKRWHMVVEILSYVFLLASLAVSIVFFIKYRGQQFPTHYTISGETDGYGSAAVLLILPVTFFLVNGASSAILHFMPVKGWNTAFKITPENANALYSDSVELIVLIMAESSIFCLFMTIGFALKSGAGFASSMGYVAAIGLTIVLNLIKSYKDSKKY